MEGKIFYITRNKLKELKREYDRLVEFEQAKVMGQEIPKLFESEDVNAEFISFQEDMSFLRSRIEELKNILANYELIKLPRKHQRMVVGLGAKINVQVGNKSNEFTIVGTLEADPAFGRISNESPVGRALLGAKVGDEITISSPVKKTYKIKKIKYEVG